MSAALIHSINQANHEGLCLIVSDLFNQVKHLEKEVKKLKQPEDTEWITKAEFMRRIGRSNTIYRQLMGTLPGHEYFGGLKTKVMGHSIVYVKASEVDRFFREFRTYPPMQELKPRKKSTATLNS